MNFYLDLKLCCNHFPTYHVNNDDLYFSEHCDDAAPGLPPPHPSTARSSINSVTVPYYLHTSASQLVETGL